MHQSCTLRRWHLGFPVQLITADRDPGDSSAQSSWTVKLAGRLEQGASPPSVTAHILLRQPIRLTLTWQQRDKFFTLRWIASPEICGWLCPHYPDKTCLINSPVVKVSRLYSSMAASHQSHVFGGVSNKVLA